MALQANIEDRKTKRLLAMAFSTLFSLAFFALLFREVPDQNRELVSTGLGFVAGWVSAIIAFYFGSTAGSETKTETIAAQAKTVAAAADTKPLVVEAPATVEVKPGE